VGRVLTEKFRLGLFEHPYADENGIDLQNEATRQVARDVATQSVTLLENNGILPLGGKPRVALVGPTADDPLALLSGYSFPVHLIISDMVEETSQVTTRARRWNITWAQRTCATPKGVTLSKNAWRVHLSSRATAAVNRCSSHRCRRVPP
jgi:beta-glucosidase